MKKIYWLLLAVTTLLLWGCPFESDYDLGDAMLEQYDQRAVGRWENLTDSSNMFVTIAPYGIEYPDYVTITINQKREGSASEGEEEEIYNALFAKVDQTNYLVVEYWDDMYGEVLYEYYCYQCIDSKNITISEVNPEFFLNTDFSSADDLLLFFKLNQSAQDFLCNKRNYRKY